MTWEKGQSGNPNGRPRRGECMTDVLREELSAIGVDAVEKKRALIKKLIAMAENGDVTAMKYIIDRIDGKPRETHSIDTEDGIEIVFKNATKN